MDGLATQGDRRHEVVRIRREPKRRLLTVTLVEDLTPRMRRVNFTSPELADFESDGFDDHVKLFFPPSEGEVGRGPGGMMMRDYTPRRFDRNAQTLVIDFVLHDAGPATAWARAAEKGTTLTIGGPRGSAILPNDFDWYVLLGDETALPAIGRRLEALPAGTPALTAVVLDHAADAQTIQTACDWTASWHLRGDFGGDDGAALCTAFDALSLPPGEGFVWIAAEAQAARTLRAHVLGALGCPPTWVKAAGYWVQGEPGETARLDGPPG